jgi:ribosomal-protein-alanine N-acetyltransferase
MTESNIKESDIKIRPMVRADIDKVVLIETLIFSEPWPKAAFEEELEREERGIIVAEIKSVIVGYAGFITAAGEAHLTNMGVVPDFRGKGIAKTLLKCILEIAKKAESDYIFLDVRPSNTAAINLYSKFGFTELYRRPNYYRIPPEDALVMVKILSED